VINRKIIPNGRRKRIEADNGTTREVIFAAGGIVSRKTARGVEIAVVHRSRYSDWCLPKGKLKKGESFEEAATREVKEEVGCDAIITGFASAIHYAVKGAPKVVLFWTMVPAGECSFEPSEEVRKVVWLNPRDAVKKIDYDKEKDIVKIVFRVKGVNMFKRFLKLTYTISRDIIINIKRLLFLCLPETPRFSWLNTSIKTLRAELDRREKEAELKPPWVDAAYKLLDKAEEGLADRDIDDGWVCFKTARRMLILGLNEHGLDARAESLLEEAEGKLDGWRLKAVKKLLTGPP